MEWRRALAAYLGGTLAACVIAVAIIEAAGVHSDAAALLIGFSLGGTLPWISLWWFTR